MREYPSYVLVVGYNNFKRHKGILQIFKDYCEMIPHVTHKEDTWFQTQDFYIFPDYRCLNCILHYLSEHINHSNIFKYDLYEYSPMSNTYFEPYPVKPQVGIILPSRINVTPEFKKLLVED